MANAVYIHIPFCTNKCHYCDFNSYVVSGQPVMEYLKALDLEMEKTVELFPTGEIKTIFVGGGTPTVLTPKEMEVFLTSVRKHFPHWNEEIEFTMEANPGTVELDKLKMMKEFGVNRISMGVQAFQDDLLSFIGRIHSEKEVYQSIENAHHLGFKNLSIDLMIGLPNQTIEMVRESLKKAIQLQLPHFSVYSLKVEQNTLFHTFYQKNRLPLPPEEDELNMYLITMEEMQKHGYHQYEISNFAKPGYESKHNITYWKNEDYFGLGAGAHGYIQGRRHANIKGIRSYIDHLLKENQLPRFEEFEVSLQEKKEDMLMLGLRMLEGVKFSDYEKEFNEEMLSRFRAQIEKLVNLGLLMKEKDRIKLSQKGLIYGNEVFAEFISV
ncbi:radical SAM family heme chaperone HemW [Tepidibacillus sp. HK-1]|uniref:radical SAM family heme chaperone HemW n=1 Tax=Tepidibacillus sp. HK-1 TaxID=1883407 RepID=UPI0008537485|nr:radical SAM family heme chaperone HemW [Tepidibacillus sp. HK-1]GBF10122.1 oxygen-independent coproporphyrinogen-III oxidase 1 [Tepidibacillus sp. HK-1]